MDGAASARDGGLIVREREPVNLEYPFDQLRELLTPNDLFYVRSHFKAPTLDRAAYRLSVEGAVERPFRLGYEDLLAMESVTRTATLECAGNSRVFLVPQVKGAQWQMGAVSTAAWTGVPLPALLERAGLSVAACEVIFEAADKGVPKEEPVPPGETPYARSLPLTKVNDVLIAYAMNGVEIPPDHGYPVRAIVPGHYGMASVKWLTKIRVVTTAFQGYFQTSDYAYWDDLDGNPVRRPLGTMALKSAIARPRFREAVLAGQSYMISGAAWGSETQIAGVDVSTDGGSTWKAARLLDEAQPFVWCRWEFEWTVPLVTGLYSLMSRAIDADGNRQPEQHDKRFGTYVIHHTFAIEVVVQ